MFIPTTANKPPTIIGFNHVPHHFPGYSKVNGITIPRSYDCPVATTPAVSIRSLLLAEHTSILKTSTDVRGQETLASNSARYENEADLSHPHELQEHCCPAEDCSNPVSGAGIGDNSNWNPDWLNNRKFLNTSASEHIFNDTALFPSLPVTEAQNSLIPDYPAGEDISTQFENSLLGDFDPFFDDRAANHTSDTSLAWIGEEPFLTATENLQSPKTPIVSAKSCDGSVLAPFEDGSPCTTSGYALLPGLEYHRDQSSTATLVQEPPAILDDQPSSSPRRVADTEPRTRPPKSRKYQCTHSACTARSFRRRSDRDRHMRKHNPRGRVFVCKELDCEKRFYRKDKLLDHSRNIHGSGKVLGALAEENMESGVAFR